MSAAFGASVEGAGDQAVLRVTGEIDFATGDAFRAAVDDLAARVDDATVVLDMAGVTFMDSSGLAVLANLASAGRTVVLKNAPRIVRTALAATGLGDVVQVDDDAPA